MVPAHFEEATIGTTLRALHDQVRHPFKALVVYDMDEDPTATAVHEGSAEWPEAVALKNAYGSGALGAIRTGLDAADTELVAVVMADLSDDPAVLNLMIAEADRGADVVSGSRYMRGGKQVGGPVLKSLMSRLAGRSLHLLTRIPTHDPTNSFRLYRTSFVRGVDVRSRGGFEIGMELTVKAYIAGLTVAEVPTTWIDRGAGQSKFKLRAWLPLYVHWYLYALRRAPLGIRRNAGKGSPGAS